MTLYHYILRIVFVVIHKHSLHHWPGL